MKFKYIPGQEELKLKLKKLKHNNNIAHAILFNGKCGYGTLPIILAFVNYILCNKNEDDSCGECDNCKKTFAFQHPDILFVFPTNTTKKISKDPYSKLFTNEFRNFIIEKLYGNYNEWMEYIGIENKQGIINVKDISEINDFVYLKSYGGKQKIVIIWMAEKMNQVSSNKILKLLEEPPNDTLFFLSTENASILLPTIVSRTQVFNINPFNDKDIEKYLYNNFQLEENKLKSIVYLSDGDLNIALNFIKHKYDEINKNISFFSNWMRLIYSLSLNNIKKLITLSEEFAKLTREEQKELLNYSLRSIRNCLIINTGVKKLVKLSNEEKIFLEKFALYINNVIPSFVKYIEEAIMHIERNAYSKLLFLDLSFLLYESIKKDINYAITFKISGRSC